MYLRLPAGLYGSAPTSLIFIAFVWGNSSYDVHTFPSLHKNTTSLWLFFNETFKRKADGQQFVEKKAVAPRRMPASGLVFDCRHLRGGLALMVTDSSSDTFCLPLVAACVVMELCDADG
ncbi:hypothetical protein BCR44DRAFT_33556 [Catenaria anguillulae PL171]|uniref:Uncharacterized protein n=1 Tax=Catenaria anguillulae PL171 TaxID=765915 RepID=A0A1Y2HJK2_9FUNG|nr:hypothetical protein BCR44DRAFT_33556 [Catenaria anguillulae PL171]